MSADDGLSAHDLKELQDKLSQVQLEAFQLQCIIDAKDREMDILRSQIGADAKEAERAEQLQQDNERLTKEVLELKEALACSSSSAAAAAAAAAAGTAAGTEAGSSSGGSGGSGGSGAAAEADGSAAAAAAAGAVYDGAVASGRGKLVQATDAEVLALNVSGQEVWVQRSTLLHVPDSLLHDMFALGSSQTPAKDVYGRPFLPFQPDAFRAVVQGLQDWQVMQVPPSATDWAAALMGEGDFVRLLQHLRLFTLFYPDNRDGERKAAGGPPGSSRSNGSGAGNAPCASSRGSAGGSSRGGAKPSNACKVATAHVTAALRDMPSPAHMSASRRGGSGSARAGSSGGSGSVQQRSVPAGRSALS